MNTPAISAPLRSARHGFTLVELLAVIAIIGILAAILIPVVSSVRRSARNAECVSNLRRLNTGIQLYAQDNKNTLPRLSTAATTNPVTPATNWVFHLTGFLNQGRDYLGVRVGTSLITVSSGKESPLLCKQNILNSDVTASSSATTYAMNSGCSSLVLINAATPSQTALLVEGSMTGNSWPLGVGSGGGISVTAHGNHSNVLYLDGHVGSISTAPTGSTNPFWNP
ncbi:MAG: prepilin-type N-terminal cleavage/methylation domain-containing protein [Opitutaceae bacterium]|jgi:general secretion pathway protein G